MKIALLIEREKSFHSRLRWTVYMHLQLQRSAFVREIFDGNERCTTNPYLKRISESSREDLIET